MTEIKIEVMDIDVSLNDLEDATVEDMPYYTHSTEQCNENNFSSNYDTVDVTSDTSDDNSKDSNDFLQNEDPFNYESSIIFEENSMDEHLEQTIESITAKNTDDELKNLIDNLITNEKTAPNLIQKNILKDQSIKNVIIFFNKIVYMHVKCNAQCFYWFHNV